MNSESDQLAVSVIIVSWNAREYLMQCLASLSTEACRYPLEIIVVDNASSDCSADAVASSYPSVRLIRNAENLGFARANNLGVSVSTGRYLCFVNSDVKVLPHCLDRLVQFCEEHPEVGMVGPRIIGGDGKLQRSCRGFPTVEVIRPSCGEFTVAFGKPKCGVLVKLKSSPRNSRRKRSPKVAFRPIMRSILLSGGPSTMPRPALP